MAEQPEEIKDFLERLNERWEDQQEKLQEIENRASLEAARVLVVLHGGSAVSLTAWLQSLEQPGTSSKWVVAAPPLELALICTLIGLFVAALIYLLQLFILRQVAKALIDVRERLVKSWSARVTGKKLDRDVDSQLRASSLKAGSLAEKLNKLWYGLFALDICLFGAAIALVVRSMVVA